jgi:hypothetical protein
LWEALNQIIAGRLEKILNSVKSAGKTAGSFLKDNAKYAVMIGVTTLYGLSGGEARGGSVAVTNNSIAKAGSSCYTKHLQGATESYDNGKDSSYFDGDPNPLHIYINNPNSNPNLLSKDAKGLTSITPYDIKLKANQFISYADNFLDIKVNDANGLEHRSVIAYDITKDINDLNNIHEIPKNGNTVTIPLPDLVNQSAGVYANWIVEMPRKVEGDLNEDGICDFKDYAILANEWKQTSSSTTNGGNYLISDLNIDRITDESDLAILASSWLETE